MYKDAAVKSFRSQNHARVNQFDVQSRLEGLQEKFFVLNNEPLATALAIRLDELSQKTPQWKPEILSLFLSLSDRPAEKTDVAAVEQPSDPELTSQLTWAEIIADDPLTEEGIWDDVILGSDISEDDDYRHSDGSEAELTSTTEVSSLGEDDPAAIARSYIAFPDRTILEDVRAVRQIISTVRDESQEGDYGLPVHNQMMITELQAAREALFMLHGFPNSVFDVDDMGSVRFRSHFFITSVASFTFNKVMQHFAELASRLLSIRRSFADLETHPLLQRIQATIQTRLRAVDRSLSEIEQRFITPQNDTVVSLIGILAEVHVIAKPLLQVGKVLSYSSLEHSYEILDSLFLTTSNLQLMGEDEDCAYTAKLFFECLEVYLKPVHLWITQGHLHNSDDMFFVGTNDSRTDLGSLWHTHFSLREGPDETVSAPSFMQTVAQRIFKTGKSVMFLDKLGHSIEDHTISTFMVNVTSIIKSIEDGILPFSEVFQEALQQWIASLESARTNNLCNVLLFACGLNKTVQAIDHVLLSRDGARFQQFADDVFARVDAGKSWDDRFLLTEAAQETFGPLACVERNRLSARALPSSDTTINSMERILLSYTMPWPLQNIIREDSPSICQQTFTKLLRVYRAEYLSTKDEWMLVLASKNLNDNIISQILALRQRLLWFVSTLRSHFTNMASLAMSCLTTMLNKASDVDDLVTAYAEFQRILADKLLLTSNLQPISQALFAILDISEEFSLLWTSTIEASIVMSGNATSRDNAASKRKGAEDRPEIVENTADLSDEETVEVQSKLLRPSSNIQNLRKSYERQLSFAIAGLRGVSRAGGEPAWIMLAERLQWGVESINPR